GELAVNVRTQAARTGTQNASAVTTWLRTSGPWETFDVKDLAGALQQIQTGSPIAGLLLLALLGVVLLETLFARWFSHAYRDPTGKIAGAAGAGDLRRGILPSLHTLEKPTSARSEESP
ncbi:MAG TPA: hypothetical protein VG711_06025, partial [Phycisphaerales bacterium]|nr:hypothetical protein [Phycisphaerales bacterium]